MKAASIPQRRLLNQGIERPSASTPADVVRALGALQGQDYLGALWSIGLRLPGSTEAAVERALDGGALVRTWPLRGTLHIAAAEDVRWLLELTAPRQTTAAEHRKRALGLDDALLARAFKAFERALAGGKRLTRGELYGALERAGVSTEGQSGFHFLWFAGMERLLCFGPRRGKQHTFALFDERVPPSPKLSKDEALARLALRYFSGHGPASAADFAWWSGFSVTDAKAAALRAGRGLRRESYAGRELWDASAQRPRMGALQGVHLLPGFDEFLLGYTHRADSLDPAHARNIMPGNGMFAPTMVLRGRVAGIWKRALKRNQVEVTLAPLSPLSACDREAFAEAAERYGAFLGLPVKLLWSSAGL